MNIESIVAALRGEFDNALIARTPGGIEQQEADGQRDLVNRDMLPKVTRGASREDLAALGFKFGSDVGDLFIQCELPAGWTKRASDHAMYSFLFDSQGRKRATIFYKAAFYDRMAHMSMLRRYEVDVFSDAGEQNGTFHCVVKDGAAVVFCSGKWQKDDYDRSRLLEERCERWLDANFADWRNPLAHW